MSLFIASKYLDLVPLQMKYVINQIGHNVFTSKEIKGAEKDIMQTINMNITYPTLLNFVEIFIENYVHSNMEAFSEFHWSSIEKIKKTCIFYGKMLSYDADMLRYQYTFFLHR